MVNGWFTCIVRFPFSGRCFTMVIQSSPLWPRRSDPRQLLCVECRSSPPAQNPQEYALKNRAGPYAAVSSETSFVSPLPQKTLQSRFSGKRKCRGNVQPCGESAGLSRSIPIEANLGFRFKTLQGMARRVTGPLSVNLASNLSHYRDRAASSVVVVADSTTCPMSSSN
jgi:hypothetical protein